MNPPIGFRTTDKTGNPKGTLNEIRPAAAVTGAATPETLRSSVATSPSRTADYTYRIAALAAGLALLASVW